MPHSVRFVHDMDPTIESEFWWKNIALTILHAGSLYGIVALSSSKWPVYVTRSNIRWVPTTNTTQSCSDTPCQIEVEHVRMGMWHVETLVVLFHLPAVLSHLYAAMWYRTYMRRLHEGRVPHRWLEYSVSASIMMVAILLLTGITSIWTLLLAFTACAATQAMGYAGEREPQSWLFFAIGSFLMIPLWVLVYYNFYDSLANASSTPPTFVYYIIWSLFILFMGFAVVNALQRTGYFTQYSAERWYMLLSLTAKSALAWQIFFGALSREKNDIAAWDPGL